MAELNSPSDYCTLPFCVATNIDGFSGYWLIATALSKFSLVREESMRKRKNNKERQENTNCKGNLFLHGTNPQLLACPRYRVEMARKPQRRPKPCRLTHA